MQQTIRPAIRPRERILAFGGAGTGKSNLGLQIMAAVTDAHHYVLDLDVTPNYERMLATMYADVETRGNFTLAEFDPVDWAPLVPQIEEWATRSHEDDWLHIDPITPTWDAVRAWYLDYTMNAPDMADFLAELRRNADSNKAYMKAIQDTMNYDLINRQYFKLYAALRKWRGHIYMTAESDAVREEDAKELRTQFQSYGVKPKGQKKLSYVPATILLTTKLRAGEWYVTTVKDRGRTDVVELPLHDFATDYLVGIAGWKRALVKNTPAVIETAEVPT